MVYGKEVGYNKRLGLGGMSWGYKEGRGGERRTMVDNGRGKRKTTATTASSFHQRSFYHREEKEQTHHAPQHVPVYCFYHLLNGVLRTKEAKAKVFGVARCIDFIPGVLEALILIPFRFVRGVDFDFLASFFLS